MDKTRLEHYRTYMRAYGLLLMMLANHDDKLLELMSDDTPGPFMTELRNLIEKSPRIE